jgi:hypothetical protein
MEAQNRYKSFKPDLPQQKLELIEKILRIEDPLALKKLNDVLNREMSDFWDTIPEEDKQAVEDGLRDIDEGDVIPFDQVKRHLSTWHSA